jgi:8-oxo-dGTP pyrophosphatase MutT (NUDIX family)
MGLTLGEDFGTLPAMSTKYSLDRKLDLNDGDGYSCQEHGVSRFRCCEEAMWGRYGAAGILFVHRASERFFLTQRSKAIHFGGTWSIPGGAIDRDETPEEGARREVEEELGIGFAGAVVGEFVSKIGEWQYTTLIVEVDEMPMPKKWDWETMGAAWFTIQEMATIKLHPGFRKSFWNLIKAWR